jgi:hypothetical protein
MKTWRFVARDRYMISRIAWPFNMPSECGTASGSANVTPFNGKAELYLGLERQPLQNRRP